MAISKVQSESINLADNFAFTGTVTGAGETNDCSWRVTMASNQNIPNNTDTLVNYDTVVFDTDSGYNTTNKAYTVPSGKGGKYFIECRILHGPYGDNSGEFADVYIQKNSSIFAAERHVVEGDMSRAGTLSCYTIQNLSAGDVIRVVMYFNQGDTRAINASTNYTHFTGFRISS